MKKAVVCIAGLFLLASCVNESTSGVRFAGPTIAVVGPDNNVYVGDGYYNSRIVVFDLSGKYVRTWGSQGYGKGQFQNPHGLAFAKNGQLLVADRDNGKIPIYTTMGNYITEWHSQALGRPWSVAVADDGSVFAVDGGDQDDGNPRSGAVKLNANGDVVCRFSSFGSKPGELNWGHAIAVSNDGTMVFVVDLNNSRLQKFVASNVNGQCYTVDAGWPTIPANITFDPLGVAFSNDTVYVTQQTKGAPILLFSAKDGAFIKEIASGVFERAHGISIDRHNTMWVTDVSADKVYRLSLDGDVLLTIGGEK